jgi:predicted permease
VKRVRSFRRLFRVFSKSGSAEESVDLEILHHIEMRTDELAEEGHEPLEARRLAEEAFGNLMEHRAQCVKLQRREERTTMWKDRTHGLLGDLAYGLRGIRRSPGFALSVITTLTLGIGANAAIFTVVDAVLLNPAPYSDADELHEVGAHFTGGDYQFYFFPWEGARTIAQSGVIPELGAHGRVRAVRTDGPEAHNVRIEALSPELLSVLRVRASMGRTILADDTDPAAPDVVVASHRYWRNELGGDPEVLGREVTLDGMVHTVVGVMPAAFRFPYNTTDLFAALRSDGTALHRPLGQIQLVGRIPEDQSADVLTERLTAVAQGMQELGPSQGEWTASLHPMNEAQLNQDVERSIWVLSGAVAVMLLIAVVNGMNLLLARGTTRAREIGVRISLGASKGRVVRQLMTESSILAILSGVAAVLVAQAGVTALMSVAPRELVMFGGAPLSLSARVLWFTFGLTTLTGLFFGLVPALGAVRAADATSGRTLSVYASSVGGRKRLREGLVVTQVALSMTLLFGAALMGKSFARLVNVNPGFDQRDLTVMEVNLGDSRYPEEQDVYDFSGRMAERLRAIPGVQSVARSTGAPPNGGVTFGDRLEVDGRPDEAREGDWVVAIGTADEEYFSTLGVELLRGRSFEPADYEGGRPVIVDEDLARLLVGSLNAVGERFRLGADDAWYEIVGVMADLKLMGLEDRFSELAMLRPMTVRSAYGWLSFNVRAGVPDAELYPEMRAVVKELDGSLPIESLESARAAMRGSVERPQFFLLLMGVFAAVAVTLAVVGLYEVLSFAVNQRRREMGVRVALGAGTDRVRSLVLGGGVKLAMLGVAAGGLISMWAAGALEELLFETGARDLTTFLFVAGLMVVVSALASYVPARRATRVDPVDVLKAD